jgi:hypothetical protein
MGKDIVLACAGSANQASRMLFVEKCECGRLSSVVPRVQRQLEEGEGARTWGILTSFSCVTAPLPLPPRLELSLVAEQAGSASLEVLVKRRLPQSRHELFGAARRQGVVRPFAHGHGHRVQITA